MLHQDVKIEDDSQLDLVKKLLDNLVNQRKEVIADYHDFNTEDAGANQRLYWYHVAQVETIADIITSLTVIEKSYEAKRA